MKPAPKTNKVREQQLPLAEHPEKNGEVTPEQRVPLTGQGAQSALAHLIELEKNRSKKPDPD